MKVFKQYIERLFLSSAQLRPCTAPSCPRYKRRKGSTLRFNTNGAFPQCLVHSLDGQLSHKLSVFFFYFIVSQERKRRRAADVFKPRAQHWRFLRRTHSSLIRTESPHSCTASTLPVQRLRRFRQRSMARAQEGGKKCKIAVEQTARLSNAVATDDEEMRRSGAEPSPTVSPATSPITTQRHVQRYGSSNVGYVRADGGSKTSSRDPD